MLRLTSSHSAAAYATVPVGYDMTNTALQVPPQISSTSMTANMVSTTNTKAVRSQRQKWVDGLVDQVGQPTTLLYSFFSVTNTIRFCFH